MNDLAIPSSLNLNANKYNGSKDKNKYEIDKKNDSSDDGNMNNDENNSSSLNNSTQVISKNNNEFKEKEIDKLRDSASS